MNTSNMNFFNYCLNYFKEQNRVNDLLPMHYVAEGLQLMEKAFHDGRQVFLIGNGGSASTASHIACDLQKGTLAYGHGSAFTPSSQTVIASPVQQQVVYGAREVANGDRPRQSQPLNNNRRFRVTSLCDNTELITAWANDSGYEVVFSEQLKTFAEEGDLLIAISASGNSPNIIRAVDVAKIKGMKVIGLTGFAGGKLRELADVPIHVEAKDYGIIENCHLMFGHLATKYLND